MYVYVINSSTGVPSASLCSRTIEPKTFQYASLLAALRTSFLQVSPAFGVLTIATEESEHGIIYFEDDIIIESAPSMRIAQQIHDMIQKEGKASYNAIRDICDRLASSAVSDTSAAAVAGGKDESDSRSGHTESVFGIVESFAGDVTYACRDGFYHVCGPEYILGAKERSKKESSKDSSASAAPIPTTPTASSQSQAAVLERRNSVGSTTSDTDAVNAYASMGRKCELVPYHQVVRSSDGLWNWWAAAHPPPPDVKSRSGSASRSSSRRNSLTGTQS
jgi:hypothetical protein